MSRHPTPGTQRLRRDGGEGWLFALPHLALWGVFLLGPVFYGFYISLHRWHVLARAHPLIGFENYRAALADDIFWQALRNTVYFVLLIVPIGNLVSLLLALGIASVRRLATFYKVVYYLPLVISIAVVAVIWGWLYNTDVGLFNLYLKRGVDALRVLQLRHGRWEPVPWLSNPACVMPSIALMSIWWGAGGNMVLYLAGINNIPGDYFEAATIDGANAWHRFRAITWPLLRPTTLFCLVFSVLGAFQIFGQTYVLYNSGSGPHRAGLTLALYMYQQGFSQYQMGYGAAVAYLLFAILMVVTVIQFRLLSGPAERAERRPGESGVILAALRRSQFGLHLLLLAAAAFFLAPLLWMLSTSLKTPDEIVRGLSGAQWLPRPATAANFERVLRNAAEFPVWRWTFNSLFVSLAVTALVLTVDALAAFAYARLKWRGRDALFSTLVATMLVPGQVLLIPSYLIIRGLGWFDAYPALIVPAGAGAFGVFLLRQFFLTIPAELEEAARIDGCGSFRVFRNVILPLALPALATLGIFTFMGTWNAFEGPLILTDSMEMRTLPIGIAIFQGHYNTEYGPLMAAAVLATIPVTIAFLLFQRHIIKGISLTGLAGR